MKKPENKNDCLREQRYLLELSSYKMDLWVPEAPHYPMQINCTSHLLAEVFRLFFNVSKFIENTIWFREYGGGEVLNTLTTMGLLCKNRILRVTKYQRNLSRVFSYT